MSTRTPPPPGYSFVSYPAEYAYSPCSCPGPHIDTQTAYSPQCYMPPSPGIHGTHTPPTSPDRYSPHSHSHSHSSGSSASLEKAEIKAMRQLCAAITKMQGSMKDMAERQEQILDRMSLLEQRVGRMDDSIEKLLENTEAALEDSKAIRGKLEDSEGYASLFFFPRL
ncbi:hypothetical protein FN846DRAFT_785368 [Sphaerosporella brunnea]|uniref:Uncharacterized protein n=1 Tax=Sphaerosporella brunnea TaxID=1250544 RepID=A0A5J5EHK9_9PEZI|nr:hypothetical protein FN846DRAFT_785368 [Sphaerosporella brunnea]